MISEKMDEFIEKVDSLSYNNKKTKQDEKIYRTRNQNHVKSDLQRRNQLFRNGGDHE